MAFGIYIHIPYCLQKCPYCDFAKYDFSEIPNLDHYTQLLIQEIRQKQHLLTERDVSSIYFGGGTPSLMTPLQISLVLAEIKKYFRLKSGLEITMEVNPGTLSQDDLADLLGYGVNRFSLGTQTFQDSQLHALGRKHSSKDTTQTLELFKKHNVNYSMDILFALPNQKMTELQNDLNICAEFEPPHVSTYYLNVPTYHVLSKNRSPDEEQVHMFKAIQKTLENSGLRQYEISNFAKPGFESQHNLVYWNDEPYWGVGLSSHSFLKESPWGARLFNPKTFESYEKYVFSLNSPKNIYENLPSSHFEILEKHQAMTEFCYTSLRKMSGLDLHKFIDKFSQTPRILEKELASLIDRGLLMPNENGYRLSEEGKILSNLVFERLTFLKEDLY